MRRSIRVKVEHASSNQNKKKKKFNEVCYVTNEQKRTEFPLEIHATRIFYVCVKVI